ncbi:DUF1015 domain-containing protein [Thermosulfidibacter takaii]|nr:DUF1015 domain-containing protein [Thermosulfidibacter takaii]
MADVRPFRGVFYAYDKLNLEELVAPPYDTINENLQEQLYQKSPYNVVRLILGKIYPEDDESNNRYTRAANYIKEWMAKGILKQGEEEQFYGYYQTFTVQGKTYTRKALIGRIRLEEPGQGSIIPHEKTLTGPKKDRLQLFKHTKMNLSPVFGIALDDSSFSSSLSDAQKKLLFEFTDPEGVVHQFYAYDPQESQRISESLKDKKILIADGHHRYETALNYMKEMKAKNPNHTGEEPCNFALMAIVSSKDPGLLVLPIHRVIKNITDEVVNRLKEELKQKGSVKETITLDLYPDITDKLRSFGKRHFAALEKEKGIIFHVDDTSDELDIVILHQKIIHELLGITEEEIKEKLKIEYFKNIQEALSFLEKGGKLILTYIPPTVEEIASYSLQGKIMPQKSTYFYPKFYSGLVFYSLV